jgi:hypothetical protein
VHGEVRRDAERGQILRCHWRAGDGLAVEGV